MTAAVIAFGRTRSTAPSLIAVAWMLVLSNHSQIHDVFVYRNVPTSIGIAVAACVLAATTRPASTENTRASFTLVP